MTNYEELHADYNTCKTLYLDLCIEIESQLKVLLNEAGVKLTTPIEYRVKSWDSILGKCEKYELSIQSVREINDISGLRIITLFKRDVSAVCEIIKNNFVVLRMEDTSDRLQENQFGYGSIHFEIKSKDSWLEAPTVRNLKGLKAEIQVRTSSHHIWAAISHVLQYKQEDHVPIPLRRSINRTAAILDMVDLEFERVLKEREEYMNNLKNINDEDLLNVDILRKILDDTFPEKNKSDDENYGHLLDDFRHFNITSVKQLKVLLKKHMGRILIEEEKNLKSDRYELEHGDESRLGTSKERIQKGVYFTHLGFARGTLAGEFGDDFYNYILKANVERSS